MSQSLLFDETYYKQVCSDQNLFSFSKIYLINNRLYDEIITWFCVYLVDVEYAYTAVFVGKIQNHQIKLFYVIKLR